MLMKSDTGWGPTGVRHRYVTHFCNVANMINIERAGMQLLL